MKIQKKTKNQTNTNPIRSPLRYPGGKSRAAKKITDLFPSFDEYREPFIGGGSVFLYTKKRLNTNLYWINDVYPPVYMFWFIVQKELNGLLFQIRQWKKKYVIGKELYEFLRINFDYFNNIEQAAAFFILNRITFSGTTLSGGYSEAAFRTRFTESSILRLKCLDHSLNNTTITAYDYEEVVKREGKNVFIFLDPPYYSSTTSALYGKNGSLHTSFDHIRFAQTMKDCPHQWLITYDDSEYIRKLFSFATIMKWNQTYGMRNISSFSDQIGKELFLSNYPTLDSSGD